ncbi:unnamed protein product [Gadus morhua 'NCC']
MGHNNKVAVSRCCQGQQPLSEDQRDQRPLICSLSDPLHSDLAGRTTLQTSGYAGNNMSAPPGLRGSSSGWMEEPGSQPSYGWPTDRSPMGNKSINAV